MTTRGGAHYNNEVALLPGTVLTSQKGTSLPSYKQRFDSKEFIVHEASGLPSFITSTAYQAEETTFIKTCDRISVNQVTHHANVISSHV